MSTYHYPAAASASNAWAHCSYYITANHGKQKAPTEDSLAGTAAHWVASECLKIWKNPARTGAPMCVQWLDQKSPEGVIIDHKMCEGAQVFVNVCLKIAQKHGALQDMLIEHPVTMPSIHPLNGGTLDFALVIESLGLIYVLDYKHGHREVRARDDFQLIDYCEGICYQFADRLPHQKDVTVVLGIVQPFCYNHLGPLDEWKIPLVFLREYFNILHNQAHAAFSSHPTQTSGIWCRDCAIVGTCGTRRKAGFNMIDYVNNPITIDSMSTKHMAIERDVLTDGLKATEARLEAIEAELEHKISHGDVDSGLTLSPGKKGNLNWTVSPFVAIEFARQLGVDAKQPTKCLTATQVRNLLATDKRETFEKHINKYAKSDSGKLKLTRQADSLTHQAFTKEL